MGACTAPQIGNPCPIPDNATDAQRLAALNACNAGVVTKPLPFSLKKDVDILFLIDNSPSMSPKQAALALNIPKFIQTIDATGANYHVGIATSDIGADVAPGQLWGGNIGGCDSYVGDDGLLQAKPCTQRTFSSSGGGAAACSTLCPDPRYVPTSGTSYISKVDGVTNVPVNMQLDPKTGKMVDLGPINAFQCMALVGDQGCGVESQLEGSRRALDGRNTGFLRPNSILAVIYITDEDDCSVQMANRNQLNPSFRDCDPAQPDAYDCYNIDYRCLARSVKCNESMLTSGVKTGCVELPNNFLDPLEKFHKFFTTLRPDNNQLLISGIWTLPSIANSGRVEIKQSGMTPPTTGTLNRAAGMGASCYYAKDQSIFGQAQFRLSQFASLFGVDDTVMPAVPNALEVSICDIDNYPVTIQKIADKLAEKIKAQCLPAAPKVVNGKPVCVVGDVDTTQPNASPDILFPVCSPTCCNAFAASAAPTPADAAIQTACAGETTDACYCAVKSTVGQCPGSAVPGIWRKNGGSAPPGKQANFLCASGG
jgi:hypothetical protein